MEIWDAEDFDSWENLRWETVQVIRYGQRKTDGTVVEAYWPTDFSKSEAGSQAIYYMAQSRWEIENQSFNDAKNRYGLERICHHHPNSLLINWPIIALTLTLEWLYSNRYLDRGIHSVLEPINPLRLLWVSLETHPERPFLANDDIENKGLLDREIAKKRLSGFVSRKIVG